MPECVFQLTRVLRGYFFLSTPRLVLPSPRRGRRRTSSADSKSDASLVKNIVGLLKKRRPLDCTSLRSLLAGYVSGDASGPFAANALYFGGDVGEGTVSFLHGSELVRGSAEVLPGVFVGGYDSACELVKAGDIAAKDFKFFARYCGWGPGQLESECARGVWYPVVRNLQHQLWFLDWCFASKCVRLIFSVSSREYSFTDSTASVAPQCPLLLLLPLL